MNSGFRSQARTVDPIYRPPGASAGARPPGKATLAFLACITVGTLVFTSMRLNLWPAATIVVIAATLGIVLGIRREAEAQRAFRRGMAARAPLDVAVQVESLCRDRATENDDALGRRVTAIWLDVAGRMGLDARQLRADDRLGLDYAWPNTSGEALEKLRDRLWAYYIFQKGYQATPWVETLGDYVLAMADRPVFRVPPECPACRYDLTGTPKVPCPECGWPLAPRSDTPAERT